MSNNEEQVRGAHHVHLVALLTFASGCVDVVGLLALGGAFTSVITGNLIFIGRAFATSTYSSGWHAALAVVGYIAGVGIGSRIGRAVGRPTDAAWPTATTVILLVEILMLLGVNIVWIGTRAHPSPAVADTLLAWAAGTLGMQGAAARRVAGAPSTTYMTGALTALVDALSNRRRAKVEAHAAAGLLALVLGAVCGALVLNHARIIALIPPMLALAVVVAVKAVHHRGEVAAQPTSI